MSDDQKHLSLLRELRKRAAAYKYIHWAAFGYKEKIYYCLNIPITLLSCFLTAMTFYDIRSASGTDLAIQVCLGTIDVVVLILSGMSTFLKCGQKSSGHQHTYREYEEFILNVDKLIVDCSILDEEDINERYHQLFDKYSQLLSSGESVNIQDIKRLDTRCKNMSITNIDLESGDMCV